MAYDTFRQVGYVARAYWFHAQDVPEADLFYGLTDASGHKKKAFDVYLEAAAYDAPVPDEAVAAPRVIAPGQTTPSATSTSVTSPGATGRVTAGAGTSDAASEPRSATVASGPSPPDPRIPTVVTDLP
jgi:hypothetical protein